ncbi:MAG: PadR family transcriptional regulator [Candidatus Bathyarchaeota archaeon]|nr:PadR family transcriptional regulator [Candidatus Bathyarchaeota archaeon]
MNDQEKQDLNELKHQMRAQKHLMFHRRNWLRHNAMVPKGFLRYHVLEALSDKPMSGSELMEEIQKRAGGHWKPSPGSIYPLLAWLQDNRYIAELPHENGLKRYQLTASGKEFFEEQSKAREKFREDAGFMAYPFFGRSLGKIPEEKTNEIRQSMKRLLVASLKLGKTFKENYSEQDLNEALKTLNEASDKLEALNAKRQGEKA